MFLYQAYGLKFASPLELPALTPAEGQADVTITLSRDFHPKLTAGVEEWTYQIGVDEAEISHPAACVLRVRAGREIEIWAAPMLDESLLQVYIVGLLMGVLLYQRGYFVLHASSAELEGGAAAFLGERGAGKSSVAACLQKRGARVLADDNTAIDLTTHEPTITPGFPELKVMPQIASSLGYASDSLRQFHPAVRKLGCLADQKYSSSRVKLRHAYVLSKSATEPIRRMSKQETIIELVRHSMPSRLGVRAGAGHLKQCAWMAESVPVFMVRTFSTLDEIPLVARLIEDHVASEQLVAR